GGLTVDGVDISDLGDRVSTNETDIDDLDGRVSTNETDIDDLDGRVSTNETDIDDLDGRVSTNETDIDDLDGRVSTNRTDIDNINAQLFGDSDSEATGIKYFRVKSEKDDAAAEGEDSVAIGPLAKAEEQAAIAIG